MEYSEIREMFREALSERFNFLCIDMTKNKNEGKYRNFNESNNTYSESILEIEPF